MCDYTRTDCRSCFIYMGSVEQENKRLERTMQELLRRIEDNQQIQAHFQDFEAQLLHCDSLVELFDKLLLEALGHFRLEGLTLLLNDADHQMRTLSDRLRISSYDGRLQFCHNPLLFDSLYADPPVVRLGGLDSQEAIKLFPQGTRIRSSALLPLVRHNRVIGSFNFGSTDTSRFTPEKSSDFLNHLARIVSVCLENCFSVESLRHQSLIDVLTQVYNRRSFELELERELARAARHHHPLACMFIDIDHFKKINDSYGHPSGDECLQRVARMVKEQLRKSDVFARYGGEEFVALMPEESAAGARLTAERIREAVASIRIPAEDGKEFQVTLSIGIASHHFGDRVDLELRDLGDRLLSQADHAMYEAKRSGRNRVCLAQ